MLRHADTIVAPITGSQPAPVAIVRLSGPDAWRIASRVFHPWSANPEPRRALYGQVRECGDGLAIPFEEGHSYTGEEAVELSIHGSPAAIQRLVDACIAEGARFAEPGEFTLRAFMNGKMDLTEAEAVRDTIGAKTAAQLRQAARHRSGELRRTIADLRELLEGVLAAVEASVDFSEEVGELDRESAERSISQAQNTIVGLMDTASAGRLLRDGVHVAILGRPNVGKSSLMNAILGMDRVIVTEIPGTTRDYVEEQVERDGLLWVISDTAGLREGADDAERMGVALAQRLGQSADVVWYVYDASEGLMPEDDRVLQELARDALPVANKRDLSPAIDRGIPTCALTGEGLDELFHTTRDLLGLSDFEGELLVNTRHRALLERAAAGLSTALEALRAPLPDDLVAVGLQSALFALGQITGETASDDLLERIFSQFCIGK